MDRLEVDSQSCAEFVSLGAGRKFSQKENLCESSGMSRQVMKVSKGVFFYENVRDFATMSKSEKKCFKSWHQEFRERVSKICKNTATADFTRQVKSALLFTVESLLSCILFPSKTRFRLGTLTK